MGSKQEPTFFGQLAKHYNKKYFQSHLTFVKISMRNTRFTKEYHNGKICFVYQMVLVYLQLLPSCQLEINELYYLKNVTDVFF